MIKVFGIVALLASALGGGFSSNGECYRSATAPSRSLGSPGIFHPRPDLFRSNDSGNAQLAQLAPRGGREWARSVHQHMQARMRLLPGKKRWIWWITRRRISAHNPLSSIRSSSIQSGKSWQAKLEGW